MKMKLSHVIVLIIMAVSVAIIVTTVGVASEYVTFAKAKEMSSGGSDENIHVVGQLTRNANGSVTGVLPSEDKLSVRFSMVDENQEIEQVLLMEPMPPELKESEQVVVVGRYVEDQFVARKVLLKCPSKYTEEEITQAQAL